MLWCWGDVCGCPVGFDDCGCMIIFCFLLSIYTWSWISHVFWWFCVCVLSAFFRSDWSIVGYKRQPSAMLVHHLLIHHHLRHLVSINLLGCQLTKLGAALLATIVYCSGLPVHLSAPCFHQLMCLTTICCCQSAPFWTATGTSGVDLRPDLSAGWETWFWMRMSVQVLALEVMFCVSVVGC